MRIKANNNMLRNSNYRYLLHYLVIVTALIFTFFIFSYALSDVPTQGNISIIVKYRGTPPEPTPLKLKKAISLCGVENIPNETLIINNRNEIMNALVYVKGAPGTVQPEDYTLKNQDCIFSPHVGFATKGGKLIMTNEDEIMHNTHAYFVVGKMKKTILNIALPKGTKPITNTRAFRTNGHIKVQCDSHEWMAASIIVLDHPYHGITDDTGKTEIKNVPTGEYDLVVFHETIGEQTQKVKVEAGKTVEVIFEMSN